MLARFTLALAALASFASAAPPSYGGGSKHCLSQTAAETLVARYAAVIGQQDSDLGNATVTAQAIAANSYTEQSDSANILINLPLGSLTVANKTAWVIESQSNPPIIATTQAVYTACKHVTWEWISTNFGSAQYQVQGIHVLTVNNKGLITAVKFEFNSVAGALDTGYSVLDPTGAPLVVATA